MFGVNPDSHPPKARRFPLWRLLLIATELFASTTLFVIPALLWLLTTPQGFQALLDQILAKSPVRMTLTDVVVLPVGAWDDPYGWRWEVRDVQLVLPEPDAPDIHAAKIQLGLPDFEKLWFDGEVHWRHVRVVDLTITAKHQRPPKPFEPKAPKIHLLSTDRLEVWGANWSAPKDPPLNEAAVFNAFGQFDDFAFDLGSRRIDAVGSLAARRFHTGALDVDDLHLDPVRIENSTLWFAGKVAYGGAPATLKGRIQRVTIKPKVKLEVAVTDVEVAGAITAASGRASPLFGKMDGVLTIESGGNIPRGEGIIQGTVRLVNGRIPLSEDVKPVLKDLIRVAPIIELSDQDEVLLGEMRGHILITRGAVALTELLYNSPNGRVIEMRGYLDDETRELVVRLRPREDWDKRPGVGILVYGLDTIKVRLARKEELLPTWEPESKKAQRRREERQARRQNRVISGKRARVNEAVKTFLKPTEGTEEGEEMVPIWEKWKKKNKDEKADPEKRDDTTPEASAD